MSKENDDLPISINEYQLTPKVWKMACRDVPLEEISSECGISVERVIKVLASAVKGIEIYERNRREDERDLSNFSKN